VQDQAGKFYLATSRTKGDKLFGTALPWESIAQKLENAKARVVVFIDACHSGSADEEARVVAAGRGVRASAQATNDQAVQELLGKASAITVIAAAKGRQKSWEGGDWGTGGGAFTTTLIDAVQNRPATDENANGVIELSELYKVLKGRVISGTNGEQTPWIARNRMVGEVPLF